MLHKIKSEPARWVNTPNEPRAIESFVPQSSHKEGFSSCASYEVVLSNKAFATLRAQFALRGHALYRTSTVDGAATYYAERWGLVRWLPTLQDAAMFLAQIGGRL